MATLGKFLTAMLIRHFIIFIILTRSHNLKENHDEG